jgi:hypothetical protein
MFMMLCPLYDCLMMHCKMSFAAIGKAMSHLGKLPAIAVETSAVWSIDRHKEDFTKFYWNLKARAQVARSSRSTWAVGEVSSMRRPLPRRIRCGLFTVAAGDHRFYMYRRTRWGEVTLLADVPYETLLSSYQESQAFKEYQVMRKPGIALQPKGTGRHGASCKELDLTPNLRDFFLSRGYDGEDGERSGGVLVLKVENGRWFARLKEPTSCLQLPLSAESLPALVKALEELLGSPACPWETDSFEQGKRARGRKKWLAFLGGGD